MKGDFTIDRADIKRIIRECYAQIYAKRFDKLEEIKKKFLEKHKLPKPTQEEIFKK